MTPANTATSTAAEPTHRCPACGHLHDPGTTVNKACDVCTRRATDSRRRTLRFEPIGHGDAFEARYLLPDGAPGGVAEDVTAFRTCFIDGTPFHVARDGQHGLHLRAMADLLGRRRR